MSHIQCDPVLGKIGAILPAHPNGVLPILSPHDLSALLQAHHMTLGPPILITDCKEKIESSTDHVKFRCPEGLTETSGLIIVQDTLLLCSLHKESLHGICTPHIQTDIIPIVICCGKVPFPFPCEDHRIRQAHGEGKTGVDDFHSSLNPIGIVFQSLQGCFLPADWLFIHRSIRISHGCAKFLQLLRTFQNNPFRQGHTDCLQRDPALPDSRNQLLRK